MKRVLVTISLALLVSYAVWSYLTGGIVSLLLDPDIPSELRLARIQNYFAAWGTGGPLAYLFIVTIEVILAPIPGTILYLPGGLIFGWLVGGAVSLAGNVLGAGIACQAMRTLAGSYVESFINRSALKKYETIIQRRGLWIVFLLRVNPLTSCDLVSYAAGLTRVPVWKVMAGTLLGMAPLCFVQAYFAETLFTAFPRLIYPLTGIGVLYAWYVVRTIRRMARQPNDRIAAPVGGS